MEIIAININTQIKHSQAYLVLFTFTKISLPFYKILLKWKPIRSLKVGIFDLQELFTDIRPHILGQVKLNKSFTDTLLGRIFGFESDAHHIIISSLPLEYELRTQSSSQNERTVVLTQIRRGFATSHTYLLIAYHIIFDIY